MISEITGYTYIDAVLALVPLAKIVPSENGLYKDAEWLDDRPAPAAEEVENKLAELKAIEPLYFLRKKRDELLAASDWAGSADLPQNVKDAWWPYRQALRDITNTYKSLDEVVWPDKPV